MFSASCGSLHTCSCSYPSLRHRSRRELQVSYDYRPLPQNSLLTRPQRSQAVLHCSNTFEHLTSASSASKPQQGSVTRNKDNVSSLGSKELQVTRREAILLGAAAGLTLSANAEAAVKTTLIPPAVPVGGPIVLSKPPGTYTKLGFESRVEEFTLPNGLHFIVLNRDVAPVVATHIFANVGAFQEVDGQTGLAHLLEHMAFKGTRRVGAKDWKQEAPLLDAMDEVFYELLDLKDQQAQGRPVADSRITQLHEKMKLLQANAANLVVPNAYGATLSRAGAVGLNASTSHDETRYFASLPSNQLEMWFALEAERFRAPVFRELYSEKRVINEERRLRVDDAPLGRFQQQYAARALTNNYRRPVIGLQKDFERLGRREVSEVEETAMPLVADFFARHYRPQNMTIALVGDVTADQARTLAEKYWADWEGACCLQPKSIDPLSIPPSMQQWAALKRGAKIAALPGSPPDVNRWGRQLDNAAFDQRLYLVPPTTSCEANSDTCFSDTSVGGPLVMLGFKRPPMTSRDGPVLQVISDILAGSRTSRMTGRLVLQDRALRGVRCIPSYPGEKYEGICLLVGVPKQGESPEDAERLLLAELAHFLDDGPGDIELANVQRSTRTSVLASALSNSAMASLLASYHGLTGSWRGLLSELDFVAELKPADVQAVAQKLLKGDKAFRGYVYQA